MSLVQKPNFKKLDLDFADPLSGVIRDIEEVNLLISKLNLIPKFQTDSISALCFLQYVKNTCAASPTHGNCLDGIGKFAFNSKFDIIKSRQGGLNSIVSEISLSESVAFEKSLLDTNTNLIQLRKAIKSASESLVESGDAYIYVRVEKIENRWAIRFETIDYDSFMYWGGDGKDYANFQNPNLGVWCSNWTQKAISEGRYKICKVSKVGDGLASWSKISKGFETIFHVKNGNQSQVYGKMGIYRILNSMITEILEDKKLSKTSQSAVTALMMLFLPMNPSLDDTQGVGEAKRGFEMVGTNKGEGSELVISEYYAEDGKPELIKLDIHRDAAWTKLVDERCTSRIYGYHNWSAQLSSSAARSTGLSQNAHLDELKKADISTIQPLQEDWEEVISEIFTAIGILTNTPVFISNSLKFERRIEKIIEASKPMKNGL